MTLILALPGPGEVVVAADTYVYSDYAEAYYSSQAEKIWKEGSWLIGIAGNELGKAVLARIKRNGFNFARDFNSVADDLAKDVNGVFLTLSEQDRSRYDFRVLMCGVEKGKPQLCEWSASSLFPCGSADRPAAIGAINHGGIYLAYQHYRLDLTTNQRMLLAYFSVHAVTQQDMRVGPPIHVAVVKEDGVTIFKEGQLSDFSRRSEAIAESLKQEFLQPGPPIPDR